MTGYALLLTMVGLVVMLDILLYVCFKQCKPNSLSQGELPLVDMDIV